MNTNWLVARAMGLAFFVMGNPCYAEGNSASVSNLPLNLIPKILLAADAVREESQRNRSDAQPAPEPSERARQRMEQKRNRDESQSNAAVVKTYTLKQLNVSFPVPPGSTWWVRTISSAKGPVDQLVLFTPDRPAITTVLDFSSARKPCAEHLKVVEKNTSGRLVDGNGWAGTEWHQQAVDLVEGDTLTKIQCMDHRPGNLIALTTIKPGQGMDAQATTLVRALLDSLTPPLKAALDERSASAKIQLAVAGISVPMPAGAIWEPSTLKSEDGVRADRVIRTSPADPAIGITFEYFGKYANCAEFFGGLRDAGMAINEIKNGAAWVPNAWSQTVLDNGGSRLMCLRSSRSVIMATARSSAKWTDAETASVRAFLDSATPQLEK